MSGELPLTPFREAEECRIRTAKTGDLKRTRNRSAVPPETDNRKPIGESLAT
jgi:hypothetical protein